VACRSVTRRSATSTAWAWPCAEICQTDGYTPNKELLDRMVDIGLAGDLLHDGKRMGLVLDVGGWYKNVITFAPSLDISYEEIDLAITLLDQALTKAKG
jgi:acetylornithine/succinyldiaminopimelate/putrescine aminotransferase